VQLIQLERITKLGRLGEVLAAERLIANGFEDVEDLNARRTNYPFADLLATRNGTRYLIGVKTRNEMRQGDVGLNASYNLVLVPDAVNRSLKLTGKSTEEISKMAWQEVAELAAQSSAVPAWVTVAARPRSGEFSAYFGLVGELRNRRSVPMTLEARRRYLCIADSISDARITADLWNG
jgi:hypothetical protein